MSNKKDKTVELEKLIESLKEDNLKLRNDVISLRSELDKKPEQSDDSEELALWKGKFAELNNLNNKTISTVESLEGRLKEALQANEECVAVAAPSEEELQKRGPREGCRLVSGKNGKGLVEVKI